MGIVRNSIFIDAPMETVYDYVRNPLTWSQWYVNLSGPKKLSGDGCQGTIAEMTYTMLAVDIPVTLKVVEDSPSYRRVKLSGGINGEQSIDFVPAGSGTELEILVTYGIPGSVLEKISEQKVVEQLVENALRTSLENLKAICEGAL